MKKTLCLFLIVLLLCLTAAGQLSTAAAAAGNEVKTSISAAASSTADQIEVSVSIVENTGFAGATVEISYDKDKVHPLGNNEGEMQSISFGESFSCVTYNDNNNGLLRFVIVTGNLDNSTATGELLRVGFGINDRAAGDAAFTLAVKDMCTAGYKDVDQAADSVKNATYHIESYQPVEAPKLEQSGDGQVLQGDMELQIKPYTLGEYSGTVTAMLVCYRGQRMCGSAVQQVDITVTPGQSTAVSFNGLNIDLGDSTEPVKVQVFILDQSDAFPPCEQFVWTPAAE